MNTERPVSYKRSKESYTFSPLKSFLLVQTLVGLSLANSFTSGVKRKIKNRAGRRSELDPNFKDDVFVLEAAHHYHDNKINPNPGKKLNYPENGVLVTRSQHHEDLVGGLINPDGSPNPGGVNHKEYTNYSAHNHLKPRVVNALAQICKSVNHWFYIPPQWETKKPFGYGYGEAKRGKNQFQRNLGAVYRPPTSNERKRGIDGALIPVTQIEGIVRDRRKAPPHHIPILRDKGYKFYQDKYGNILDLPPEEILFAKANFNDPNFRPRW